MTRIRKAGEQSIGELIGLHRGELFDRIVGALRAGIHHVDPALDKFLDSRHTYLMLTIAGATIVYKPAETDRPRMEAKAIRTTLRRAIGRGGNISIRVNPWSRLGQEPYIEIVMYIAVPT